MKTLRTIHLIAVGVIFAPLLMLIAIGWFITLWVLFHSFKKAIHIWVKYIERGIEMNRDFVENGL